MVKLQTVTEQVLEGRVVLALKFSTDTELCSEKAVAHTFVKPRVNTLVFQTYVRKVIILF